MLLAGHPRCRLATALFTDPYTPHEDSGAWSTTSAKNGIASITELTGRCSLGRAERFY